MSDFYKEAIVIALGTTEDLRIPERHPATLEAAARILDQLTPQQRCNAVYAAQGRNQPGPDGPAIDLAHGFHDLDFLPKNDRTRYTLHPTARRELLIRLLKASAPRIQTEDLSPCVDVQRKREENQSSTPFLSI